MVEPPRDLPAAPEGSAAPVSRFRRTLGHLPKILRDILVCGVVGYMLDLVWEKVNVDTLRRFNEAFFESVKALDPWNLDRLFFAAFDNWTRGLMFLISPFAAPYAYFDVGLKLMSQGLLTILTTIAAFAFGYLVTILFWMRIRYEKKFEWYMYVVLLAWAPLPGSCFMWVLLHLMMWTSTMFGDVIGSGSIAGMSVGGVILAWVSKAVVREREHALTSRILHVIDHVGG